MTCNYPLCRLSAMFTPVVVVPTIRTVGMHLPNLHPLSTDHDFMRMIGLDSGMAIRQYEAAMEDYRLHSDDMVKTDRPTYLIGREVCQAHRDTFNLFDWFHASEWVHLQEAARSLDTTCHLGRM